MRQVTVAMVLAAAMVLPAQAQRFGGMGGGFSRGGFRGGFGAGFHGTTGVRNGLPSRGAPIRTGGTRVIIRTAPRPFFGFNNGFGRFGFGNVCFANPILCRGRFGTRRFRNGFGFGFGFPFGNGAIGAAYWPAYPWDYGDYGYMSANYASGAEQQRLQAEVDDIEQQLRRERVRRMEEDEDREEQAEEQRSAPAAKPATAQSPQKPTVLVFRDQHRAEIQNYAIVGGTLYEFASQQTRKIMLSQLDVPATVRANEERGVEFRVPAQR